MYKTNIQTSLQYDKADKIDGHTHEIPNYSFSCRCSENVIEENYYVINLKKGSMYYMKSYLNIEIEDNFLDKICECIISKYAGHDIEIFKAGQSDMLKEKILEFLGED